MKCIRWDVCCRLTCNSSRNTIRKYKSNQVDNSHLESRQRHCFIDLVDQGGDHRAQFAQLLGIDGWYGTQHTWVTTKKKEGMKGVPLSDLLDWKILLWPPPRERGQICAIHMKQTFAVHLSQKFRHLNWYKMRVIVSGSEVRIAYRTPRSQASDK